jgi:GNAT superfamily N-acetyltransferase
MQGDAGVPTFVTYQEPIENTAAFVFLAEACNELVLAGFTPDNVALPPFKAGSHVIYAVGPDGDIVGAMTWGHALGSGARIELFYVESSSRKLGVAKQLLQAFATAAAAAGVTVVDADVPDDHPLLAKLKAAPPWRGGPHEFRVQGVA